MKTKKDKDNAVAMALPRPRRHTWGFSWRSCSTNARGSSPPGISCRSLRTFRLRRCGHSFFSRPRRSRKGATLPRYGHACDSTTALTYVCSRNWWWLLIIVAVCGEDSGCTGSRTTTTSTWWAGGETMCCPLRWETWCTYRMPQVDPRLSLWQSRRTMVASPASAGGRHPAIGFNLCDIDL
jgi:hypothetical protein